MNIPETRKVSVYPVGTQFKVKVDHRMETVTLKDFMVLDDEARQEVFMTQATYDYLDEMGVFSNVGRVN